MRRRARKTGKVPAQLREVQVNSETLRRMHELREGPSGEGSTLGLNLVYPQMKAGRAQAREAVFRKH